MNIEGMPGNESNGVASCEFTFSDYNGQNFGPDAKFLGSLEAFGTFEPPPGVTHIDGYIHTPVGEFGIQMPIEKAKNVITDINDLVSAQRELTELQIAESSAKDHHLDQTTLMQNGKISDSEWIQSARKRDEVIEERKALEHKIAFIKSKLKEYML